MGAAYFDVVVWFDEEGTQSELEIEGRENLHTSTCLKALWATRASMRVRR